jgi:hypothetical protein
MNIKHLNVIKRMWNQKSSLAQHRLALKKEQIKEEAMETHRVSVTVTDPQHSASTMRNQKIEKRVRVKARDKDHAIDSAINHYKKAGYKVHDHNYIGKVNEEVEELDEVSSDLAKKARDAAFAKGKDDQAFRFVKKAYEKGKKESDAMAKKIAEEAPANNVGSGNIAGTQGDAGKKAVMTKEPLKRKKLTDFKEWVELDEAAVDSKGHKSSTGGLTQKGRDYYNNKTGGNLKAPVTTPPSKLDPDSKAAKRRKSFCARMGGMKKRLTSAKTANDPDSRINKALRKWNC